MYFNCLYFGRLEVRFDKWERFIIFWLCVLYMSVEPVSESDETNTTMGAVAHLLALVTWVIGPLVLIVATDDWFVEENAKAALNWQLSFTLWMVLSAVLSVVLVGLIGLFLLPIVDIVLCVIAAVKASEGEVYDYPFTVELV